VRHLAPWKWALGLGVGLVLVLAVRRDSPPRPQVTEGGRVGATSNSIETAQVDASIHIECRTQIGSPASEVRLRCIAVETECQEVLSSAITNGFGRATLRVPTSQKAPAWIEVRWKLPTGGEGADLAAVSLPASEKVSLLTGDATISGRVVGPDGLPCRGVAVRCWSARAEYESPVYSSDSLDFLVVPRTRCPSRHTKITCAIDPRPAEVECLTGENGEFLFGAMNGVPHRVALDPRPGFAADGIRTVWPGEQPLEIRLERGSAATVNVVDPTGQALLDVEVLLAKQGALTPAPPFSHCPGEMAPMIWLDSSRTDSAGRATFACIPPRTRLLLLLVPMNGGTSLTETSFGDWDGQNTTVTCARRRTISGTVVRMRPSDVSEEPGVWWADDARVEHGWVPVDGEWHFAIEPAVAGSLLLAAGPPWEVNPFAPGVPIRGEYTRLEPGADHYVLLPLRSGDEILSVSTAGDLDASGLVSLLVGREGDARSIGGAVSMRGEEVALGGLSPAEEYWISAASGRAYGELRHVRVSSKPQRVVLKESNGREILVVLRSGVGDVPRAGALTLRSIRRADTQVHVLKPDATELRVSVAGVQEYFVCAVVLTRSGLLRIASVIEVDGRVEIPLD
jgi:hypothetical protein